MSLPISPSSIRKLARMGMINAEILICSRMLAKTLLLVLFTAQEPPIKMWRKCLRIKPKDGSPNTNGQQQMPSNRTTWPLIRKFHSTWNSFQYRSHRKSTINYSICSMEIPGPKQLDTSHKSPVIYRSKWAAQFLSTWMAKSSPHTTCATMRLQTFSSIPSTMKEQLHRNAKPAQIQNIQLYAAKVKSTTIQC